MKDKQRTICVWAENKCGVLVRVVGIISAKGANIDRLIAFADQSRPGRSKILIVATLEHRLQERVVKEINRLVNVVWAVDVTDQNPCDGRILRHCEKTLLQFRCELDGRG